MVASIFRNQGLSRGILRHSPRLGRSVSMRMFSIKRLPVIAFGGLLIVSRMISSTVPDPSKRIVLFLILLIPSAWVAFGSGWFSVEDE